MEKRTPPPPPFFFFFFLSPAAPWGSCFFSPRRPPFSFLPNPPSTGGRAPPPHDRLLSVGGPFFFLFFCSCGLAWLVSAELPVRIPETDARIVSMPLYSTWEHTTGTPQGACLPVLNQVPQRQEKCLLLLSCLAQSSLSLVMGSRSLHAHFTRSRPPPAKLPG